jgi:hypothetical protein
MLGSKRKERWGMRASSWSAIILAGLALWVVAGCGDDEDKNLVVRNVSVAPALLTEGDVGVIEVLVTNRSGAAQDDETVYMSAIPAASVTFTATAVTTNALGIAATTFTAAEPGSVLIGARVGNNPSTEYVTIVIEESDDDGGGGTNGQVTLTITPPVLVADGQATAAVHAVIADNAGDPIPDNTPVKFVAGEKFNDIDGDGAWTPNVDALVYDADADGEWDALGVIDRLRYAANGQANATFTAGFIAGPVHIKVTAGSGPQRITGEAILSLVAGNPVHTIALSPERQRIQVRGTGGIEWTRIVAEAYDEHGNPADEGLPIEFLITAGPGGGETVNGEAVGPVTARTNALGQATVTLNAGTLPGTVRLRARAGTVLSTATQVTIRSGPPAAISCGVEDCNVPSWSQTGYNNRVLAVVVDQWGNEVPDSTAVYFGTEQGLIEGAAETMIEQTVRGKAETFWNSGEPRNDPYVYIWCETAGGTVRDTCVFLESGAPSTGTFVTWPQTMVASGDSLGRVEIAVLDINGVFVDTDTPIELLTDFGSIQSGLLQDGCNSATYIGYYRPPVLDQDYSYTTPGDGIGVVATIRANAGGPTGYHGSVNVTLLTGKSDPRFSQVNMASQVHQGAFVPVEVVVRDYDGNPLGGHEIEITVQSTSEGISGSISGSTQFTDQYGVARGFIFTADNPSFPCNHTGYLTIRDVDPQFGGMLMVHTVLITCQ